MTRNFWVSALVGTTTLLAACATQDEPKVESVDQSSNVHLKGGAHAKPSFVDGGLTLAASGELAGLGDEDILVTLSATGNPTATCTNPAGATQPPGHNPASVTVTGSTAIPAEKIKNGNVAFSVTTEPPVSPIPDAPDCPNPQWTEAITGVSFTSAIITIMQPPPPPPPAPGTVVLTVSCTFSPATSNGAVTVSTVTCTSS